MSKKKSQLQKEVVDAAIMETLQKQKGIKSKYLWEYMHPYCAADGSEIMEYKSWKDYIAEWGNVRDDLNLVYRWDFEQVEGIPECIPMKRHPDPSYRAYKLTITIIQQRKSIIYTLNVDVCENDMPAIKKYLKEKFDYLKELWKPIGDIPD